MCASSRMYTLCRPETGRVGHLLAQVANIVDRVVRRRVHLDHVQRGGVRDRHARIALPARARGRAVGDAVQAGGEDLRHAGLAGPPRAHEQVGVVDLALLDGVAERADHVLLTDDVGERAGTVAAVERGAGRHGKPSLVGRSRGSGGAARAGAVMPGKKGGPCTLRRSRYPGRGHRIATPARCSRGA